MVLHVMQRCVSNGLWCFEQNTLLDDCSTKFSVLQMMVGSSSKADYLMRNAAMDDSIGGS
jgi:hypothetical protein